jgi:hypothetical protein
MHAIALNCWRTTSATFLDEPGERKTTTREYAYNDDEKSAQQIEVGLSAVQEETDKGTYLPFSSGFEV